MEIDIPNELVRLIKAARNVAVLTGAGTSAESGVPTFREAQTGLWSKYDPQQLATPEAFQRNPQLVWDWYAWRRTLVSAAKPNAGHFALAKLAEVIPNLILITQNVDGLHQQAGSQDVIELHGNISRTKCFDCGRGVKDYHETDQTPPRCPYCSGRLRPDVVWFGENLSPEILANALSAAQECEIFLSIGTSSVVHPAASLPLEAMYNNAVIVEVNPDRTPISAYMNHVISGPSGLVLPVLLQMVVDD